MPRVSITPSYIGTQPLTCAGDNGESIRPLGDIEHDALALVNSLDSTQQKEAIVNESPIDVVLGPGEDGKTIRVAGRCFSAGADITELDTLADGAAFGRFIGSLAAVLDRLAALPKPTIAAINGFAFGGGFELALACDLRLASTGAQLGVPEIKLGLLPGAAGTQRLARLLPAAVAKHLLMTGEPIGADEALRLGLVNGVHYDVAGAALTLAGSIADGPPRALAAAKRLVDQGPELGFAEGIALERAALIKLFDTTDRVEGVAAFLAKRPPRFTGA